MVTAETINKIKHLYEKCLADLNDWEKEFVSDMYERVSDAEDQELSFDEYYISRRQSEKIDEVWEDHGF